MSKNAFDPEATPDTETLDVALSLDLKAQGKAFRIEKHTHSYPHCWRTDKPVLYYPLDSWFIRSTAARERMMELNDTIKWKPASTGSGRFGKWLENLQDLESLTLPLFGALRSPSGAPTTPPKRSASTPWRPSSTRSTAP